MACLTPKPPPPSLRARLYKTILYKSIKQLNIHKYVYSVFSAE